MEDTVATHSLRCSLAVLAGLAGCNDSATSSATNTADCTTPACGSSQSETSTVGAPTGTADGTSDVSGSTASDPICGDGIVEAPEQCDGSRFAGVVCPESCRFAAGTVLWETTFDWKQQRDYGSAIAFDAGAVVIAGAAGEPSGPHPLLLWVSDEGGVTQAVVRDSRGPVNTGPQWASHIHTDDAGFVVVGSDLRPDAWLARYAHDGELVWETIYATGDLDSGTHGNNAATLEDGRIALFGEVDLGGEFPAFIATFDEGLLVDEQFFAGPPRGSPTYSNPSGLRGVLLSGSDVVIAGSGRTSEARVPWMQRRVLGRDAVWGITLESQAGQLIDGFTAVAVRPDGSIVATAHRELDDAELRDAWVGAFSPDGEQLWSDTYTGEYHRDDRPTGIAADAQGNVFVHLTLSDDNHPQPEANYDLVVIKYGASGNREWIDRWSGPGSSDGLMSWDSSGAIAIDADGFVVVTGSTIVGDNHDVVVRKLAP